MRHGSRLTDDVGQEEKDVLFFLYSFVNLHDYFTRSSTSSRMPVRLLRVRHVDLYSFNDKLVFECNWCAPRQQMWNRTTSNSKRDPVVEGVMESACWGIDSVFC